MQTEVGNLRKKILFFCFTCEASVSFTWIRKILVKKTDRSIKVSSRQYQSHLIAPNMLFESFGPLKISSRKQHYINFLFSFTLNNVEVEQLNLKFLLKSHSFLAFLNNSLGICELTGFSTFKIKLKWNKINCFIETKH